MKFSVFFILLIDSIFLIVLKLIIMWQKKKIFIIETNEVKEKMMNNIKIVKITKILVP